MFAVAPVDNLGKIKHVHRSQIRTRIQLDHPAVVYPESPSVRWVSSSSGDSGEGFDLWMAIPGAPQAGSGDQTMRSYPAASGLPSSGVVPATLMPNPLEVARAPDVVSRPLVDVGLGHNADMGPMDMSVSSAGQYRNREGAVRRAR